MLTERTNKMKVNNFSSGYSKEQYDLQFKKVTPRLLIGQGLEERLKFDQETKRPVEPHEVENLRAWLYYPGLGVQSLKLPGSYSLPKDIDDLSEVDLVSPEACVINRQVYVRASAIKAKS